MAFNAGNAFITISPDMSKFTKDIKAKFADQGEEAAKSFSASFKAALGSLDAKVKADADTTAAKAKLDDLTKTRTAKVKVSVDKGSLTVQNVVAGTCDAPNPAYERGNVKWCGPNQGAGAARPVGSLVDKVTIKIPSANGGHGSGFPGFPGKPWGLVSTPQSGKYTVTDLR